MHGAKKQRKRFIKLFSENGLVQGSAALSSIFAPNAYKYHSQQKLLIFCILINSRRLHAAAANKKADFDTKLAFFFKKSFIF